MGDRKGGSGGFTWQDMFQKVLSFVAPPCACMCRRVPATVKFVEDSEWGAKKNINVCITVICALLYFFSPGTAHKSISSSIRGTIALRQSGLFLIYFTGEEGMPPARPAPRFFRVIYCFPSPQRRRKKILISA